MVLLDKVYVTTGDDPKLQLSLQKKYPNKFLYLSHKYHNKLTFNHLCIFPFNNLCNNYLLPIMPIDLPITRLGKKKIKVLLLGNGYEQSILKQFIHMHDIEFYWINRKKRFNLSFIHYYVKSNTFKIFQLLRDIDFILYPSHERYTTMKIMSGVLPLAIGHSIPLIIDKNVANILKLNKCIIIEDNNYHSLMDLMQSFTYNYDELREYRDHHVKKNIIIMDSYVNHKIPSSLSLYKGSIHFIWISDDAKFTFPVPYLSNIQSFHFWNPSSTIFKWNHRDIVSLMKKNEILNRYQTFYENLPSPLFKADIARLIVLYLFGGLYVDCDFYCLQNLYPLLIDKDIAFFYEPQEHALKNKIKELVFNGFIYSKFEKSDIILFIIDYIYKHFKDRFKKYRQPWKITGPLILTEMLLQDKIPQKIIYDSSFILPLTSNGKISNHKSFKINQPSYVFTIWNEGSLESKKTFEYFNENDYKQKLNYFIQYPEKYDDKSSPQNSYVILILISIGITFLLIIYYFYRLSRG